MDEFVCEYLLRRQYPGNVRDLRRLILRIMYHHVGDGPITIGDIPKDERLPAGQNRPIGATNSSKTLSSARCSGVSD